MSTSRFYIFIVGHIPFMESLQIRIPVALTKELKEHSKGKGLERKIRKKEPRERHSKEYDSRERGSEECDSRERGSEEEKGDLQLI